MNSAMKRTALIFLGAMSLSSVAMSQLSYDFASDNQGWRRADFNPSTYELTILGAATWNAGGYIDGDDFSGWAFHLSPDLSGGFQGTSSIEFDYSSLSGDAVYPFLILRGQNEAIFQSLQVPADNQWHHYSYAFTPGTWFYSNGGTPIQATAGQINGVLTNLFQIGVSADMVSGDDYTRVDNLALVPEPASMAALGLGALALLRRKKCAQISA